MIKRMILANATDEVEGALRPLLRACKEQADVNTLDEEENETMRAAVDNAREDQEAMFEELCCWPDD